MRVGTWNLAGRWTPAHADLLDAQRCDVWLLTEVGERLEPAGFHLYPTAGRMAARRHWAAVATRSPAVALPDPHPASAAVRLGPVTYCASILPWRSCGTRAPWVAASTAGKTAAALADLDGALPRGRLVWGGDWNHALTGPESVGSLGGRAAIVEFLAGRRLLVPTAELPHRIEGLASIDHVAVDLAIPARARRFDATGLSDHDGYVVEF